MCVGNDKNIQEAWNTVYLLGSGRNITLTPEIFIVIEVCVQGMQAGSALEEKWTLATMLHTDTILMCILTSAVHCLYKHEICYVHSYSRPLVDESADNGHGTCKGVLIEKQQLYATHIHKWGIYDDWTTWHWPADKQVFALNCKAKPRRTVKSLHTDTVNYFKPCLAIWCTYILTGSSFRVAVDFGVLIHPLIISTFPGQGVQGLWRGDEWCDCSYDRDTMQVKHYLCWQPQTSHIHSPRSPLTANCFW